MGKRKTENPVAPGAKCDKPGGGAVPRRDRGKHLKPSGLGPQGTFKGSKQQSSQKKEALRTTDLGGEGWWLGGGGHSGVQRK